MLRDLCRDISNYARIDTTVGDLARDYGVTFTVRGGAVVLELAYSKHTITCTNSDDYRLPDDTYLYREDTPILVRRHWHHDTTVVVTLKKQVDSHTHHVSSLHFIVPDGYLEEHKETQEKKDMHIAEILKQKGQIITTIGELRDSYSIEVNTVRLVYNTEHARDTYANTGYATPLTDMSIQNKRDSSVVVLTHRSGTVVRVSLLTFTDDNDPVVSTTEVYMEHPAFRDPPVNTITIEGRKYTVDTNTEPPTLIPYAENAQAESLFNTLVVASFMDSFIPTPKPKVSRVFKVGKIAHSDRETVVEVMSGGSVRIVGHTQKSLHAAYSSLEPFTRTQGD